MNIFVTGGNGFLGRNLILYAIAFAAERAAGIMHNGHPIVTRHGVVLYGTNNRHSIEKARTELGYVPKVGILAGIELACLWYQQRYIPRSTAPNPVLVGPDTDARSTATARES